MFLQKLNLSKLMQMNALLDSQYSAIKKLSRYKVGALFMRPGTGKTRAAIELAESTRKTHFYWFTPFQNKENLNAEINKWAINAAQHYITGIETISSSDRVYLELFKLLNAYGSNSIIIVDESLKIKNWNAKRTQRIIELGKFCEYKLILNGTPVSRNLLDLWPQMEFLSPKILNMDQSEFKNNFCEYTKITKRLQGKSITREFINKYHNVDYLYSLIGHYIYESDLELNIHKQYIDVDFNIDKETKAQYQYLKETYLNDEVLQWKNNNIFLELTQKMQHLYCICHDKFRVVDKILQGKNLDECVIFTKYIDSEKACKKRWPKVKVLSIQKHSFGLNLQNYNISIIWDKTWDYALLDQLEHRTYRTGQKKDCIYYNLNGNVGLEYLITNCIEKKKNLLEYLKHKTINQIKKIL